MTALFPTFGNWLQRAKRFLSTDTHDLWQHICNAIEADEQRYERECQAKGVSSYIF